MLAKGNVYPVECEAYSSGATPISSGRSIFHRSSIFDFFSVRVYYVFFIPINPAVIKAIPKIYAYFPLSTK